MRPLLITIGYNQMIKFLFSICLLSLSSFIYCQSVNDEINQLTGSYSGEWTSYKLNEELLPIKALGWKDTLVSSQPIINDTLAYVEIDSKMIFDDPHIPNYKLELKEGFKIEEGAILSYFISVMGEELTKTKINDSTYIISQNITPYELIQLGVDPEATGTNTTVKLIVYEGDVEIHKVSRLSTIIISEGDNKRTIQFTSLEGYHKKYKQ